MQIIPVLDLMNGEVVRGVAGRRESYQKVQSVLTSSCAPLLVAEAFRNQLGLSRFYVADLDAIQFGPPQLSILEELATAFPGLWLDCGIRVPRDVPPRLASQDVIFVVGLETMAGPSTLKEMCGHLGPERVVFSLDLKAGSPLGQLENWASPSPWDIAKTAIESGVKNLIVLDLAQVGEAEGVSTLPLCRRIKREFPEIPVVTGGGIRHAADLIELERSEIDGVLVASAFHNGSLRFQDLQRWKPC